MKRVLALLLLSVLALPAEAKDSAPRNLGFEEGALGEPPPGWLVPKVPGYRVELSSEALQGEQSAHIVHHPKRQLSDREFGNVMQRLDAAPYRGKRVRFRAAVRSRGRAQLWLRVDRAVGTTGFFDNMGDRPIAADSWQHYEIVAEIDPDAAVLNFGCMLFGGSALIDDVSLELVGTRGEGNQPPRPLSEKGLDNLTALARVLGYVRYFHPSDEAAATDWDAFTIAAVETVEAAEDPVDLAGRLTAAFASIAPTMVVQPSDEEPRRPPAPRPDPEKSTKRLAWEHHGVGIRGSETPYLSRRIEPADPPAEPLVVDLPGGVTLRMPLVVAARGEEAASLPPSPSHRPEGWSPSGDDRATRIADVILSWNVFQHFYPYFDVVETDWPRTLRRSLSAAARDPGARQFLDTLRRLVARLEDGHGRVFHGSDPQTLLPLALDLIEDRLVVTGVGAGVEGVAVGDVVQAIDGEPAGKRLARLERFVSGTPQWRRARLLTERVHAGSPSEPMKLTLRTADGRRTVVELLPTAKWGEVVELRPEKVGTVAPGIVYVDLDRVTQEEFDAALPQLEQAKGIVFDLRGYPKVNPGVLGHLIDEPVTCAQWLIPTQTLPDRKDMQFAFSNWPIPPVPPRLKQPVAFITDGRAISYAETLLGIVEHYRLADIVGAPTAGANGNINPFVLPGGYRITWTGMKVLKHDGSQHHLVGIAPTIPVKRTLKGVREGRDELLERAIEVVSPDGATD